MSEIRFPDPSEREKRSRLVEMLDVGKVMVYIDPRHPGVEVPRHLRGQVAVPLNLSRRFQLETFDVGPLAVKASLSFGGTRYLCVLPYRAIFGLYGHADATRVLFADALPPEVAVVEAEEDPSAGPETDSGHEADASEGQGPADAAVVEKNPERSAPALRLVE